MYNKYSDKAEEFINHEEILDTLQYAEDNKDNTELIQSIMDKAKSSKGLDHREAAVLLLNDDEDILKEIKFLAKVLKDRHYGNRIVLFAPLYLSNYCINGCVYCPYHGQNTTIDRIKLTQDEIRDEVIALQNMGHKRIALEMGEDPVNTPLDYVLESIDTIYSTMENNGAIRRVNVNIAATTVEEYKKLKEADIGTYVLFQETYNKENYEKLHPTGPKSDYAFHTEAMDRAMDGGIDDVGIGVLFGLNNYKYDLVGLLMHGEHLEATRGVGPHTISVPRIRSASDIDEADFENAISDEIFEKIIAILRISVPYTGMIISTREPKDVRERAIKLGISQISGGSKTSVGGYGEDEMTNSAQFDLADHRTLDEIIDWLLDIGEVPSFCTACYREGRTGDVFMDQIKGGHMKEICQFNALITLKEYIEEYGTSETVEKGLAKIQKASEAIEDPTLKAKMKEYLSDTYKGHRDLRI